MLIRDLEGKSGLDRATIRFYEKEGLIIPERKGNGYREYSEDNLTNLLKIKLLRQLGISLDTIKGLQQGSVDFSLALSIQIRNLEHVMQVTARAKDVCTELYDANTSYETFDPVYYLQQLNKQETRVAARSFREYVERPYHPIRRFLARVTDYAILRMLLEFLLVVILRIRPYGEFLSNLISYGTPFLMIPIASLMLYKWGTTPGKWLYGLSVFSENGCKLTFSDAMDREWQVLMEGYGFGVPFWSFLRLYKSYSAYQEWDMDWDRFSEYQFKDWNNRQKVIVAASAAIIAVISLATISDVIKPRYRGDVSVSQFAANYNFYYTLVNNQFIADPEMRSDGTWYPDPNGQVTFNIAGTPIYPQQNFEFQTDGSSIQTIRYENTWTDIQMLNPVTSRCEMAAVTAVMSQKGMGFFDILSFSKIMDSADLLHDGNIVYKNIIIKWDIEAENCTLFGDLHYTADDDAKPSQASVVFEIRIQKP